MNDAFRALVFAGAYAVGFRDVAAVQAQFLQPSFPFDYPHTAAGARLAAHEAFVAAQAIAKQPANRRHLRAREGWLGLPDLGVNSINKRPALAQVYAKKLKRGDRLHSKADGALAGVVTSGGFSFVAGRVCGVRAARVQHASAARMRRASAGEHRDRSGAASCAARVPGTGSRPAP